MVGRGLEQPDVVARLLDVAAEPCKPMYAMAADVPLVLAQVTYDSMAWVRDSEARVCAGLRELALQHALRLAVIDGFVELLAAPSATPDAHAPLLTRAREPSFEARKRSVARRLEQRADADDGNE